MAQLPSTQPFNAVFRALVTLVKTETGSAEVRGAVKRAYRVWDARGGALAAAFHDAFAPAYGSVAAGGYAAVPGGAALVAGREAAEVEASLPEARRPRYRACVLALFALSAAAHVDDAGTAAAAEANAASVDCAQRALADAGADAGAVIMDDDVAGLVTSAGAALRGTGGACGLPVGGELGGLGLGGGGGGALMALARDISGGIDPGLLSRPDGVQRLVSSVSAGIGQKLGTGELDAGALLREASGMLQNVDVAEALKMLGGLDLSAMAGGGRAA